MYVNFCDTNLAHTCMCIRVQSLFVGKIDMMANVRYVNRAGSSLAKA